METYDCLEPMVGDVPNGPSADFINAVSEFLDTDPTDLLVELGYYETSSLPESGFDSASSSRR